MSCADSRVVVGDMHAMMKPRKEQGEQGVGASGMIKEGKVDQERGGSDVVRGAEEEVDREDDNSDDDDDDEFFDVMG